jgi:pimeloyl-ACP methyl ester carboxylesterase
MISGESLGGWVATHLAVHRPATVEKLVLNTAGGWKAHPQVMERLKKLSNEAASDPLWMFRAPWSGDVAQRITAPWFSPSLTVNYAGDPAVALAKRQPLPEETLRRSPRTRRPCSI